MADSPGSQCTNEDPTGPDSAASQATLVITPANAAAKFAFSEVSDWILEQPGVEEEGGQGETPTTKARAHAAQFMWCEPEKRIDADVTRFLRRNAFGQLSSSSPSSSISAPPPAHDGVTTAPESQVLAGSVKSIWTGCYFLDLVRNLRGWAAGRVRLQEPNNDFVMAMEDSPLYGMRQRHAIVKVHKESGRIYIQKASSRSEVEIDGVPLTLGGIHLLNNYSTRVRFGELAYQMEYTRFAQTPAHSIKLRRYINEVYGTDLSISRLALTPTPSPANSIKVGIWDLTNAGTIGTGGVGRVSIGVNSTGKVVALKRVSIFGRDAEIVQRRTRTMESLTRLATSAGEERIMRLVEIITDDHTRRNLTTDVWFALEPAVEGTLAIVELEANTLQHRLSKVQHITTQILGALDFLHSENWIHGDIKSANIGVRNWNHSSPSIVLLDIDDAIHAPTRFVSPNPGHGGTVGWLSPEREMTGFTATTDVWAVGVLTFLLLFGEHPWQQRVNPWRRDVQDESQRPRFLEVYERAVERVKALDYGALRVATLQMVRHPYAQDTNQRQERPMAREILLLLDVEGDSSDLQDQDEPSAKRNRRES